MVSSAYCEQLGHNLFEIEFLFWPWRPPSSLDVVTVGICSELGNMFALAVSEVQAEVKCQSISIIADGERREWRGAKPGNCKMPLSF